MPPPSRPRNAAATRLALLEAARTRFTRVGYEATTLRDVAADVGVNLALIKRYFGSKEGLFKAALAGSPRFLAGAPHGREAFLETLARQLSADTWPEFDQHPVLMLLQASGDDEVTTLRREALEGAARRILDALGLPSEDQPPKPHTPEGQTTETTTTEGRAHAVPTRDDVPASNASGSTLLRAELLIALGVGVAVLRSTVGIEPLRAASAEDLSAPLRDVVDALLPPQGP